MGGKYILGAAQMRVRPRHFSLSHQVLQEWTLNPELVQQSPFSKTTRASAKVFFFFRRSACCCPGVSGKCNHWSDVKIPS